jgi:mannosyltransferase OCH1-like enzyme
MTTTASEDNLVGAGVIWSFWEGGQTPDLVLRCFESIRIQNPTRPFFVLNRATLPKFLDLTVDFPLFRGKRGTPDDFSSVQILADWVRFKLLEKYGGVWLDASIICTSPVDNWIADGDHVVNAAAASSHDDGEDEMQIKQLGSVKNIIHMFHMHANPNIHAFWAMAAMEPGNPVIQAWLQEMNDIFNEIGSRQDPLDYIKRVMTNNKEVRERWNTPQAPPLPYLWVYLALQVVLHRQPDLHSHICLHSSVDGPMYRRYMYC